MPTTFTSWIFCALRCEAISAARCTTHSGCACADGARERRAIGEIARPDRARAGWLGAGPAHERDDLVAALEQLGG